MNINKIKKYNNFITGITSLLLLIFLSIGLFGGIIILWILYFNPSIFIECLFTYLKIVLLFGNIFITIFSIFFLPFRVFLKLSFRK